MASNDNRIYRSHRPLKTALTVFFILLAIFIVLAFAVFFGFRKYIVYTSDGVRLEVPWLEESETASGDPLPTDGEIPADGADTAS